LSLSAGSSWIAYCSFVGSPLVLGTVALFAVEGTWFSAGLAGVGVVQ
jgi:hypothetical protein